MHLFARFHAKVGCERGVERALAAVLGRTREEPGCLAIDAFRAIHDDRLFYLHSQWRDEEAFDEHAEMPHTVAFVDEVSKMIDHPFDTVRAQRLR